jgi:RHS repeat-associated protein
MPVSIQSGVRDRLYNLESPVTKLHNVGLNAYSASGLQYFGARYYDAKIGRFISQDPIDTGPNPYSYPNNDPLNLIDPTGMYGVGFMDGLGGGSSSNQSGVTHVVDPYQTWSAASQIHHTVGEWSRTSLWAYSSPTSSRNSGSMYVSPNRIATTQPATSPTTRQAYEPVLAAWSGMNNTKEPKQTKYMTDLLDKNWFPGKIDEKFSAGSMRFAPDFFSRDQHNVTYNAHRGLQSEYSDLRDEFAKMPDLVDNNGDGKVLIKVIMLAPATNRRFATANSNIQVDAVQFYDPEDLALKLGGFQNDRASRDAQMEGVGQAHAVDFTGNYDHGVSAEHSTFYPVHRVKIKKYSYTHRGHRVSRDDYVWRRIPGAKPFVLSEVVQSALDDPKYDYVKVAHSQGNELLVQHINAQAAKHAKK